MDSKTFIFDKYQVNEQSGEVVFTYGYDENGTRQVTFEEKLILPEPSKNLSRAPQHLLESLHLILGISYYKLYCPRQIRIDNFTLTKEQSHFWNTVYTKGLGEFFFKNNFDYRDYIQFPYSNDAVPAESMTLNISEKKILVPVGGGKDSIVTLEFVREMGYPFELFSLNSYPVIEDVARVAGVTLHSVKRVLDPQLKEYNQKPGVMNGHVPISAIYGFISVLFAAVNHYSEVVFSNEKSSNYGNVEYLGEMVSHQWSKSREFEDMFRSYLKEYITPDIQYFSLMRPLYEIYIAKMFTQYPHYFDVFSSSNHNFKIEKNSNSKWDYTSAKTAFVYALLAAFLPKKTMVHIFGADLFDMKELSAVYKELLGIKDIKPFDCVGTPEEVQVAFYLAYSSHEYNDSVNMNMFAHEVLPQMKERLNGIRDEVFSFGDASNIPEEYVSVIRQHLV